VAALKSPEARVPARNSNRYRRVDNDRKAKECAMTDDKKNRSEPDRSRISLNEEYEVQYWTERFGITKEQLALAIKKVGDSPEQVARLIGRDAA
jgi:hypothetical protein